MNSNLAVFKMDIDCGRMGTLNGVFVERKDYVSALIENQVEVYFGEVLGKHSEICGFISEDEIVLVSDDKNVVNIIVDNKLSSGYNPFEYSTISGLDVIDVVKCIVSGNTNCEEE